MVHVDALERRQRQLGDALSELHHVSAVLTAKLVEDAKSGRRG